MKKEKENENEDSIERKKVEREKGVHGEGKRK